MKPTNLVVEAEFTHVHSEDRSMPELISDAREYVKDYMRDKGYKRMDNNPFSSKSFLSMTFVLDRTGFELSLLESLKQRLGLTNAASKSMLGEKKTLKHTRNDMPFEVSVVLSAHQEEDSSIVVGEVRSEPVLYQKYKQNFVSSLGGRDYTYIIEENKKFLNNFIKGIGGVITQEPHSPVDKITNNTHDRLEKFGFEETLRVLEEGKESVEEARISDGLKSLRLAEEKFFQELVENTDSIDKEPKRDLSENIDLLQEKGILSEEAGRFAHQTMYSWLFRTLSEDVVHDISEINYVDAVFMYDMAERTMDHYIEKVLLGR